MISFLGNREDHPQQAWLVAHISRPPGKQAPQGEALWAQGDALGRGSGGAQAPSEAGAAAAGQHGLPGKRGIHGASGFAAAHSLGTLWLGGTQRLGSPEPWFSLCSRDLRGLPGGGLGGCGSDPSARTPWTQTSPVQGPGACTSPPNPGPPRASERDLVWKQCLCGCPLVKDGNEVIPGQDGPEPEMKEGRHRHGGSP